MDRYADDARDEGRRRRPARQTNTLFLVVGFALLVLVAGAIPLALTTKGISFSTTSKSNAPSTKSLGRQATDAASWENTTIQADRRPVGGPGWNSVGTPHAPALGAQPPQWTNTPAGPASLTSQAVFGGADAAGQIRIPSWGDMSVPPPSSGPPVASSGQHLVGGAPGNSAATTQLPPPAQAYPAGTNVARLPQTGAYGYAPQKAYSVAAATQAPNGPSAGFGNARPNDVTAGRPYGTETTAAVAYGSAPSDLPMPARSQLAAYSPSPGQVPSQGKQPAGSGRRLLCEFVLRHRPVEDVVPQLQQLLEIDVVRNAWQPSMAEELGTSQRRFWPPQDATANPNASPDIDVPVKMLVNPVKNCLLTYASPGKMAILAEAISAIDVPGR